MSTKSTVSRLRPKSRPTLPSEYEQLKAQGINRAGHAAGGRGPGSIVRGRQARRLPRKWALPQSRRNCRRRFDDIAAAVRELNEDPACTGFIVQLPLPKGINERDHRHDRPGQGCRRHAPVQPRRTGAACARRHFDAAALPPRCAELLDAYDIDLNGRSVRAWPRHRGRTIGLMLTRNAINATVTMPPVPGWPTMRRADMMLPEFGRIRDARQIKTAPCWSTWASAASTTKKPVATASRATWTRPAGLRHWRRRGPMTRAML